MDHSDLQYGHAFRLMGDALHLLADALDAAREPSVPQKDPTPVTETPSRRGATYQGARFLWVQVSDGRWAPTTDARWEVYATRATPEVTQRWLRDRHARFVAYHESGYADIYLNASGTESALDAAEAIISACEASEDRA